MIAKHLGVMFFVLTTLAGFSQGVSISEARGLYFSMRNDPLAALKLYKRMNDEKQNFIPVLLAYKGASSAASAGEVNGLNNKFSYFIQGKVYLEQAVRLDPKDPEIRFLRLATQTNAPGFLFYKGNIREDKKIVMEGLADLLAKKNERSMALNIVRSLLVFDCISAQEKQFINQLILLYE